MDQARKVCEMGHAKRKEAQIKVRQPLGQLKIKGNNLLINESLIQLISKELNVKKIELEQTKNELDIELDTQITSQLKAEGEARDLVRQIQDLRKQAGCQRDEKIKVFGPFWPDDLQLQEYIKKETLATELLSGKELKIASLDH